MKKFLILLASFMNFPSGGSLLLAQASTSLPISHFIFIIQENHSFDNYFGTYPGANGIPPGTKFAQYPGGPLTEAPFLLNAQFIPHDLTHTFLAAAVAYHSGAMDGFLWAAYKKSYLYYGKAIPVPTPDPNLVQIVPNTSPAPALSHSSSSKTSDVRQRSNVRKSSSVEMLERVSPNGFIDDEDAEYPEFGGQRSENKTMGPAVVPRGSPNPRQGTDLG